MKIQPHNKLMKIIWSIIYPAVSTIAPENIETTAKPRLIFDWHLYKLNSIYYERLYKKKYAYNPKAVPSWCSGMRWTIAGQILLAQIEKATPIRHVPMNGHHDVNAKITCPNIVSNVDMNIQNMFLPILSMTYPKRGLPNADIK